MPEIQSYAGHTSATSAETAFDTDDFNEREFLTLIAVSQLPLSLKPVLHLMMLHDMHDTVPDVYRIAEHAKR